MLVKEFFKEVSKERLETLKFRISDELGNELGLGYAKDLKEFEEGWILSFEFQELLDLVINKAIVPDTLGIIVNHNSLYEGD